MSHFIPLAALLAVLGGCAATQTASGPDAPGYTGRTNVIGSTSTIAGDADATYLQQKWGAPSRR